MSWYSVVPMITLKGHFTAKNYEKVLDEQIHSMVQFLFSNCDGVFPFDKASVPTAHITQDCFHENEDDLRYLSCLPQSPDPSIIEPFSSTLDRNIRGCYPPSYLNLPRFCWNHDTIFP